MRPTTPRRAFRARTSDARSISKMRRFPTSLSLLVIATVALTACGQKSGGQASGSTSASPSGSAASGPDCSAVWSGHTLPQGYTGCVQGAQMVKAQKHACESGQVVVTFGDRYYAVPGGPINDVGTLEKSAQYRKAVRHCNG